jgi:hypothetical protein
VELKREHDARIQALYARWMNAGAKIGFAVALVSMLLYATGAIAPFVPLEKLTALWGLPVGRFLELTGAPTGWGWLAMLGYGDYLNLLGIAMFASLSLVCYLRILPALLAGGDRLYALIALAQILVLLVAASGLLNSFAGG